MHKKKKKVYGKKILWLIRPYLQFFDAIIRICGYFRVADIVCSDSDR